MSLVAGASRYVNQAAYTNKTGAAGQSSNLISEYAGSATLLDIGRLSNNSGIGLSASARSLNKQFLSSTSGTYNQLFSASGGGSSSVDAALIQIRGLQSTVPTSRDSPEVRSARLAAQDIAASATEAERGALLDESV